MRCMPVGQRDRLGEQPGIAVAEQCPGLAQPGGPQSWCGRRLGGGAGQGERPSPEAAFGAGYGEIDDIRVVHAQQEPDPFGRLARRHENEFGRIVAEPDQRLGAIQDQHPGALIRPRGSEPFGVVAPGGGPVDDAAGKRQPGQYPVSVRCGQGPSDGVTGAFWPPGGSGPSGVRGCPPGGAVLPRASTARVHRVPAPGLTSAVRASSCHRYATASAPLSSMPISTFSLGAWMRSEFRPAAMKTSGAARISARPASGPLPPSLVNSASVPNARSTARLPAWTAGEPIGAEQGRTPGPSGVTAASIPDGVWAATYSPSPASTCAGSWSATRRNDTLACASRGTMVFGPGPV